MTILILHGIAGYAGIHWEEWLYDQLQVKGHTVMMPSLPNPDHPDRTEWLAFVQKLLTDVPLQELTIICHSLGVATALDFLETILTPINILISVSGFAEDYGAGLNSYFMKEKTIDFEKVKLHVNKSYVVYGDDDPYVPQATLRKLADNLEVIPNIIHKGGHLNMEAGFTTFPFLVKLIE